MPSDLTPILEYWYKALGQQVGIIILTSDTKRLMSQLYAARANANDSRLEALSICTSPTSPNELWIVHKTVRITHEGDRTPSEAPDQPV